MKTAIVFDDRTWSQFTNFAIERLPLSTPAPSQ